MKEKGGYSFRSPKDTIWASYSIILSKVLIPEYGKLKVTWKVSLGSETRT